MVVALIALGVALGGTSYAALTISGKNVRNNSLTGKDVKNSSLTGQDVKNKSVSGLDLKDGSVGGADIVESSLGKVATAGVADSAKTAGVADSAKTAVRAGLADSATTATTATNAGSVGGVKMIPFVYRSDSTNTRTTLALLGGLRVDAACPSGDNGLYLGNTLAQPAEITATNVDLTDEDVADVEGASNSAVEENDDVDAAFVIPGDTANGQAGFVTSANKSVRVLYTLKQDVNGFDCSISGLVIG